MPLEVYMRFFLLMGTLIFISCRPVTELKKDLTTERRLPLPTKGPASTLPSCANFCREHATDLFSNRDGYSYLAFPNFGYRGIGRCRGHALVTQKFSLMGNFRAGETCDLSTSQCLNEIKNKISDVLNFKVRSFTNFKNLYELSSHPELKTYLHTIIKRISHKYPATASPVEDDSYATRELDVFYELKRRVELGQLPYVGVFGKLTGSHALLIYDTGFANKRDVLCVRDPNIVLGRSENCDDYVYVEDNKVYYQRHDRDADYMSFFQLTSDEDKRVVRYQASLKEYCLASAATQGLCQ